MAVKLIALDMDGTTLNNENIVSQRNHAAIHRAREKGIAVAVCTGRCNTELLPIINQLPDIRYFINGNGCKIYDKQADKTILSDPLSFSAANTIYRIVREYPVMLEVYTNEQIYTSRSCYEHAVKYVPKQFVQLVKDTRTPLDNLKALFRQDWQKPIYKLNAFFYQSDNYEDIRTKCKDLPAIMTGSTEANLEFNSMTASKGTALSKLAQMLHAAADEVMAIGDGSNDVSMLEYAGYSVAMANAVFEAKKAAKYSTVSNADDGVAIAIEKYAL
ncbi:Cof-type HAD-IIB family hydrolase [Pectinatus frisingensis]|jgi:Cof subfamily protein (haloacid dehalogenase superfamily)|uniref:Cof-type HAD-IIB family hydrolase n=1 Tax=Pectinatus frisingensis TaxID=865 RepID=UPI0015F41916|nr:Cof-type HAD-IIB family hydrolase [Pectinatus frisingensis]